jgi:hypothetical protein
MFDIVFELCEPIFNFANFNRVSYLFVLSETYFKIIVDIENNNKISLSSYDPSTTISLIFAYSRGNLA